MEKILLLSYFTWMTSVSAFYTGYGYNPYSTSYLSQTQNICYGRIARSNSISSTIADCPVPYFHQNSEPITRRPKITELATVKSISIDWFLTGSGEPAISVSFDALCPDFPQLYEITVLAENHVLPVYCGRISTPRPINRRQMKVTQTLGMDLTCPSKQLKANFQISVSVAVVGAPSSVQPLRKKIQLPDCDDSRMYFASECKELRRRRIVFSLQQDGNATVVVLMTKTAYLKQNPRSKVNLGLRKRNPNLPNEWEGIHKHKVLYWPSRVARFENMTPGQTYSVVAWRDGELQRYMRVITIKNEVKKQRAQYGGLMRRFRMLRRV